MNEDELKRGRFEGEVMTRLDIIAESVRKVEQKVDGMSSRLETKLDSTVFIKHEEQAQRKEKEINSRLATLERRWWVFVGGAAVAGFIWVLFQPHVSQAVGKIFQN